MGGRRPAPSTEWIRLKEQVQRCAAGAHCGQHHGAHGEALRGPDRLDDVDVLAAGMIQHARETASGSAGEERVAHLVPERLAQSSAAESLLIDGIEHPRTVAEQSVDVG